MQLRFHVVVLALALMGAAACTITPERIKRIEVENELLREEIRIIKENCSYYKTLELDVDKEAEDREP